MKIENIFEVTLFIGAALLAVCLASHLTVNILKVSEPQEWTRGLGIHGMIIALVSLSMLQNLRNNRAKKQHQD